MTFDHSDEWEVRQGGFSGSHGQISYFNSKLQEALKHSSGLLIPQILCPNLSFQRTLCNDDTLIPLLPNSMHTNRDTQKCECFEETRYKTNREIN